MEKEQQVVFTGYSGIIFQTSLAIKLSSHHFQARNTGLPGLFSGGRIKLKKPYGQILLTPEGHRGLYNPFSASGLKSLYKYCPGARAVEFCQENALPGTQDQLPLFNRDYHR